MVIFPKSVWPLDQNLASIDPFIYSVKGNAAVYVSAHELAFYRIISSVIRKKRGMEVITTDIRMDQKFFTQQLAESSDKNDIDILETVHVPEFRIDLFCIKKQRLVRRQILFRNRAVISFMFKTDPLEIEFI